MQEKNNQNSPTILRFQGLASLQITVEDMGSALGIGQMLQKKQMASLMKKLYLDTERIVYRLIFREGMVTLAGYPD